MWVVKLGGSLLQTCDLPRVLDILAACGAGQMIIVPGGGIHADRIRDLQSELRLDDVTAHGLALRAMEKFGAYLAALNPCFTAADTITAINECLEKNKIPIWFPCGMIAENPEIRASWDISSDSLALWLARSLDCPNLLIVKSTMPEREDYTAAYLSQQGYLDSAFAEMLTATVVKSWWLLHHQISDFSVWLKNQNNFPAALHEITAIRA